MNNSHAKKKKKKKKKKLSPTFLFRHELPEVFLELRNRPRPTSKKYPPTFVGITKRFQLLIIIIDTPLLGGLINGFKVLSWLYCYSSTSMWLKATI